MLNGVVMEKHNGKKYSTAILLNLVALLCFMGPALAAGVGQVQESFLYSLSNFSGRLLYKYPSLAVDTARNEIFTVYQNEVTVFNDSGMEVFRFGDSMDLGQVLSVAVGPDNEILLLRYREGKPSVLRCDYRGEPVGEITLAGIPEKYAGFNPNCMAFQDGRIYLASQTKMQVVIVEADGGFVKGFDIFDLLGLDEDKKGDIEMAGFTVDKQGNMLFTVPVLFTANIMAMDGTVKSFGKSGGAPGRFNIVAGMVEDSRGNYLVADKLKCAIIVFDKNFNFIKEFGYRGDKPDNLIVPQDMAIDQKDRIYVTQGRGRGISVFRLTYDDSSADGEALGKVSQNKGGMPAESES